MSTMRESVIADIEEKASLFSIAALGYAHYFLLSLRHGTAMSTAYFWSMAGICAGAACSASHVKKYLLAKPQDLVS
jgi:hypothetical protein